MGTKRFSPTRKLNKTNISDVPTGKPIVYRLLNKSGDNVYTGTVKRLRSQERLQEHMPGGPDPVPGASSFQVKQVESIKKPQQDEKRIIEKEKPKHNKT